MFPTKVETTELGDRIYHYGDFEMWVPYDGMKDVVEKYDIFQPDIGASECGFEAFCEYLTLLPSSRYLGKHGDDIDSLVGMFDEDLRTYAKISELRETKKRSKTCRTK